MPTWEEIARKKRDSLFESIPQQWRIPDSLKPPEDQLNVTGFAETSGFFTLEELEFTSKSAADILTKLSKGEWKSEDVTAAFCKRAAAAHQLTNCLSDILFDVAMQDARRLDEHLRQTGRPKGPLHGLPISIKDNFNLIGRDSTLGFVHLVDKPHTRNSPLVDILWDAGAVIYVKTNVPTAMMIAETVNNVFGRTMNPLNRKLSPGGSSGGEAALIVFGGSVLGVGSDIGGSLRIPAACSGIYTIRPSFGRFPTLQTTSGLPGQEAVQSVNGPLARNVQDLELYCQAIVAGRPWVYDPRCVPLPWREQSPMKRLKIGVMWDDGVVYPTPPVSRALRQVVEKLKAAGHQIVDWEPIGHTEGITLLSRMFLADGGISIQKLLEPVNEPVRPEMTQYEDSKEIGVHEMWNIQAQRTSLCKDYLDRWNACVGLDAILCPTTPYATVEHGDFKYVGYTGIFNLLDYTAVSFPTNISVDEVLDRAYQEDESLSPICAEVRRTYNSRALHGMPVSLQLVGRRLEEEKVLAMTEIVTRCLS